MKRSFIIILISILLLSLLILTSFRGFQRQKREDWNQRWEKVLEEQNISEARLLWQDFSSLNYRDADLIDQRYHEYQQLEILASNRALFQEKLVDIPAGQFEMGDDWQGLNEEKNDEIPIHSVEVNAFMMLETELSNSQALVLFLLNPDEWYIENNIILDSLSGRVILDPTSSLSGLSLELDNLIVSEFQEHKPLNEITWFGSIFLCNMLSRLMGYPEAYDRESLELINPQGFRLPSEAEWEWAAGAGLSNHYAGGNNPADLAWFYNNSEGTPQEVAQKEPNDFGLYDMSGNVYEWCQDWYDAFYYNTSPTENPPGPDSGYVRVIRGGSYSDRSFALRVRFRFFRSPRAEQAYLGFRPVISQ